MITKVSRLSSVTSVSSVVKAFRESIRAEIYIIYVLWYIGTMITESQLQIERVQTGVRMEKRILKVLKALAEYHDMSLGDLLEGIVLHAFDGKTPFSSESLKRIQDLRKFYALDLDSSASHRLKEIKMRSPQKRGEK